MPEVKRGRPQLDKARRSRDQRRTALHQAMLACYEIIEMARKELAELDAADAAARAAAISSSSVTAATPNGCPACEFEDGKPCCTRRDGCVVWTT